MPSRLLRLRLRRLVRRLVWLRCCRLAQQAREGVVEQQVSKRLISRCDRQLLELHGASGRQSSFDPGQLEEVAPVPSRHLSEADERLATRERSLERLGGRGG